ncbi:MAG TPA: hypothetical protein DIT10_03375 [Chryseobacterium sp.]|nr:hypothetical protein [Chryseobacterium sp.]
MVYYHKDHSVSEGFTTEKIISNYIYSYSIKDKKVIDNLKGNTGSFIIFWLGLLVISIVVSISEHSFNSEFFLEGYNYGYLINAVYNLLFNPLSEYDCLKWIMK